ncbi:hypothetical protein ACN6MY_04220 [Peribacillus sp. B-H-3]|uniref:hypothetical protein n=1 Tax=Peribacillus sp. B-H-3 TaxID=3400420 RepID=UPI003B01A733
MAIPAEEFQIKSKELFEAEVNKYKAMGTTVFGDYNYVEENYFLNIYIGFGIGTIIFVNYHFKQNDVNSFRREEQVSSPDSFDTLKNMIENMEWYIRKRHDANLNL